MIDAFDHYFEYLTTTLSILNFEHSFDHIAALHVQFVTHETEYANDKLIPTCVTELPCD